MMNRNFLPSSNGKISDKQFLQLRIDKLEPSDNSFAFFFFLTSSIDTEKNSNLFSRSSKTILEKFRALFQTKTYAAWKMESGSTVY